MARAAPSDRSRVRPLVKGPRSFTRTTTVRLVLGLPTTRQVPKGKDRCAAVLPLGLNLSPDAVRCPASSWPYQVARTVCSAKVGVVKNIRPSVSQFRIIKSFLNSLCRTLCVWVVDWWSSDQFTSIYSAVCFLVPSSPTRKQRMAWETRRRLIRIIAPGAVPSPY